VMDDIIAALTHLGEVVLLLVEFLTNIPRI
jgi:hypothetical protein